MHVSAASYSHCLDYTAYPPVHVLFAYVWTWKQCCRAQFLPETLGTGSSALTAIMALFVTLLLSVCRRVFVPYSRRTESR